MEVRIIGIRMLIQQMDAADIKCLCNKYLHIDYERLDKKVEDNRLWLEYFPTDKQEVIGKQTRMSTDNTPKPSVIIISTCAGSTSALDPEIVVNDCNITLELKKPFFDAAAAFTATGAANTSGNDYGNNRFELGKLIKFITRYKQTIKQLDIAYLDD